MSNVQHWHGGTHANWAVGLKQAFPDQSSHRQKLIVVYHFFFLNAFESLGWCAYCVSARQGTARPEHQQVCIEATIKGDQKTITI